MASNVVEGNYQFTDQEIWEKFENYNDCIEVFRYVASKAPGVFDDRDAIKVAKKIMRFYSKEDILTGKADAKIEIMVIAEKSMVQSIKKVDEKPVYVPLYSPYLGKKNVSKDIIKKVLSGALGIALVVAISSKVVDKLNDPVYTQEISSSIGMLAAATDSDDYKHGRNIVSQNTYIVNYGNNGVPLYAYNPEKIADDIIEVCSKDPELFELCMYDVYFNMDTSRLANMDDVLDELKTKLSNDTSKQFIYEQIASCQVYLDYLITNGLITPDDPDYEQIVKAIKQYKISNSFNELSEKDQKTIKQLINLSQQKMNSLGNTYQERLKGMVDAEMPQSGGRK